jgi:hypothetical protein
MCVTCSLYTNSGCVYHLLTLKLCEEEIDGGKKELKTEGIHEKRKKLKWKNKPRNKEQTLTREANMQLNEG